MATDFIRYDLLVQDALRSVVRKVLSDAAREGLPGDHHFNISFKTQSEGTIIPPALKQRYPEEMAIILQHEFWDLVVSDDRFEVSLNFSRKPERLTIPFDAVTGFSDPSVPFGFKLEPRVSERSLSVSTQMAGSATTQAPPARATKVETSPPKGLEPRVAPPSESAAQPAAGAAKIVSIGAFRKK